MNYINYDKADPRELFKLMRNLMHGRVKLIPLKPGNSQYLVKDTRNES